jgi:F0F1-type ATP synthase assembly protein I
VAHPASLSAPRYPAGRIALWQLLASAVAAGLGGWWAGWQGALSAFLGGVVNVCAGVVFAMLVRLGRPETAAATLRTMLRAEAAKVAVIVLQLWLVLTSYREIVPGAFIAAFVCTVLVSQAAILIRD